MDNNIYTMKKFSKVTKTKVNDKPLEEEKVNEVSQIKGQLMRLMDDFLTFRYYGTHGRVLLEGKDAFISSIINLFLSEESKSKLDILNEAKYLGLDKAISLEESKKFKDTLINETKKVSQFINSVNSDNDALEKIEFVLEKIDKSSAYSRYLAFSNFKQDKLSDSCMDIIANKFLQLYK